MKKRLFATVLSLLMLFSLFPATALAAGSIDFEVGNVTAPRIPGNEIAVPIVATANVGYGAGIMDFHWDNTALELTNVAYSDTLAPPNGPAPLANTGTQRLSFGDYLKPDNYTGTGTFFTLTFKILDTATAGDYIISLSNPDIIDAVTLANVPVTMKSGTVTLTETPLKTLDSIAITTPPTKTTYTEGESFDAAGMVVTATYDDASTVDVTASVTCAPAGALAVTDTSITVSYTEGGITKTATQPITVNPATKVLDSIAITTPPAKTAYTEGESFDPAGMVVTATYDDASTADVTASVTCAPAGALALSDTSITVSYTEGGITRTAVQTITVSAATTSIDFEVGNVTAPLVPGNEIAVPIVATANVGYGAGIMDFHWDNTALELTNVAYSDTLAPPNGPAPLANTGTQRLSFGDYLKPDNYTGTGTFFTLTFKILDTATAGDYTISLSNPDIIDAVTLANVAVTMKPGTVTLTGGPTAYDIWVGGTRVTDANKGDVLSDGGSVVFTPASGPNDARLTLTGATINGAPSPLNPSSTAVITSLIDLVMEVNGVNTLAGTDSATLVSFGISAEKLTLEGTGTLNVSAGKAGGNSFGIYADSDLIITGGTVNVTSDEAAGYSYGLFIGNGVSISGGMVSVTAGDAPAGNSMAISASSVSITDGTVTAIGNDLGYITNPDISGYTNPTVTVNTAATATGASAWNGTDALGGTGSTFKYVKVEPGTPAVVLDSIAITTPPTKTVYTEGESFDPAGMVVTATYDDASTAPVTGYTCTPAGALSVSDTTITVSYTEGGITRTANVTVTVNPAPTIYTVSFNANGGSGTMTGATAVGGTAYTLPINGFAAPTTKQFKAWAKDSAAGTQYQPGEDVTLTADSTFYAVWEDAPVTPKALDSIAVTTLPTKTTYTEGESFDQAGMVVTATYDDATTAEAIGYVVSPSGPLTTADTAVTVSYTEGGITKTVTVAITVAPAPVYTVTFNANGGSVTPASATTGTDGKLASLPTPTRSGSYSFNGWYTTASGGTLVNTSTVFTADTTIYAHWTYTDGDGGVSIYNTLTFNTNGGSSIPSISRSSGSTIPLDSYKPTRDGYTFLGWFSDPALTNRITEVRLTSNTTIYAKWTKVGENPFTDVKSTDYFYDAVLWAVENGVTEGTSAAAFSPDMICSRAQMVTFLWRAAGSPAATGTMPFTDVPRNAYYYNAVLWAWNNGVTLGTSATTFSPEMTVTRGQVAVLLYRYNGSPAVTGSIPFTDVPTTAYYYDAIRWAVKEEITVGTSATTFSPESGCTRAQIVTFLWRSVDK